MVHRLLKGGHQCVVYDMSPKAVAEVVKDKAVGTASLAEFAKTLTKPRAVWLMVPAGVVEPPAEGRLLTTLRRCDEVVWGPGSA